MSNDDSTRIEEREKPILKKDFDLSWTSISTSFSLVVFLPQWLSLSRCATTREMWNQPTPITLTDFAVGEAIVRHEAGKRASERTNDRGTGEDSRIGGEKESGREARSGGSHPLVSPPRDSGLVTTSGWYVEPKPYVSSWLTSLSPFPPRLYSLPPKFYLSLALSSIYHRSTTRTLWLSSLRPLFTFFPSRPARLSRILFPWFTRPSRKRGEFAHLSTVLFPILCLLALCLFILLVHRFLSFLIMANAVKDGNVEKPRIAVVASSR